MSMRDVRERSLARAKQLGYPTNPHLPLLDAPAALRTAAETADRILALHSCVAVSFGLPADRAKAWLAQEKMSGALSPVEESFLTGAPGKKLRVDFQFQVEALWALTWASSYHDRLDFARVLDDSFVKMFPDLKVAEPCAAFHARATMRSVDDVTAAADLAYCLHWAVRDRRLHRRPAPAKLQVQVVEQRRKALEWLIGVDPWDEVPLDT